MKKQWVIIAVAIILAGAGYWGAEQYVNQQVQSEAGKWLEQAPKDLQISYAGLKYSLLGGKLSLDEIGVRRLGPDQTEIARLQMNKVEIKSLDHQILSELFSNAYEGKDSGLRQVFARFSAEHISSEAVNDDEKISCKASNVEIDGLVVSPGLRASIASPLNWFADDFTRAKNILAGVRFGQTSLTGLEMDVPAQEVKLRVKRLALGPFDGAVLGQFQLEEISLAEQGKPGLTLGKLSLEGYDLGNWKGLPQALSGDPKGLLDMLATLRFQSLQLAGLKIVQQEETGFFKLGELRITSPGPLQFAEFSLLDVDVSIQPEMGLKVGALQIEGADARHAIPFIQALRQGRPKRYLKPPLMMNAARLKNVTVNTPKGVVSMQHLSMNAKYHKDSGFATEGSAEMAGLKMPATLFDAPAAQQIFRELGYQEVVMGCKAHVAYDMDKKEATVSELSYSVQDAGTLSLAFVAGMDLDLLTKTDFSTESALHFTETFTYNSAELTYTDSSLMQRILAFAAKKDNTTVGALKAKLKQEIGQAGIGLNPQTQSALLSFVENPQRLTISLKPAAPLSLVSLVKAGTTQGPDAVAKMLNLQVKAN